MKLPQKFQIGQEVIVEYDSHPIVAKIEDAGFTETNPSNPDQGYWGYCFKKSSGNEFGVMQSQVYTTIEEYVDAKCAKVNELAQKFKETYGSNYSISLHIVNGGPKKSIFSDWTS